MMQKIKISLADDHVILRDGLEALLNKFEECEVIATASNGEEILDQLKKGIVPDVLILDINMPVMDGYQTAEYIKKHYPKIKMLVLTMYDSEFPTIKLLQSGVKGILKKDVHPDDFRKAINTVYRNGIHMSSAITERVMSLLVTDDDQKSKMESVKLSEQEIAFLKLSATDHTYKEIAAALKISFHTLENMRIALFDKLGVKSRQGLMTYAMKNGIIPF